MFATPSRVNAKPLENLDIIKSFYLENGSKALWVNDTKLNGSGKALLASLRQSWKNGLNPDTYNVEQVSRALKNHNMSKKQLFHLEILLTDGYIQYMRDISSMRINARDMGLDQDHWRQPISAYSALSLLSANHSNISNFLLSREPQGATYKSLKSELAILMSEHEFSDELYSPIVFNKIVKLGDAHNDIPRLRSSLKLNNVTGEQRYIYDMELMAAVKNFQREKGLAADGIIGRQTLAILNQTPMDKITQIIVNMERMRWLSDKKPDRFIAINIPSATLWAIDSGKVEIEMPVIVGRKSRPTKSFVSNIHGVRFNPTWTVPPTIMRKDILPRLREDSSYLTNKDMELYDGFGKHSLTLDPTSIDWADITSRELNRLRMVQGAGANNPLGQIRVLMPNKYHIYLHDTNHRELFSRSDRAKSSGCVRMQGPEKIALFALAERKGWSEAKMHRAIDAGETKEVYTRERIPVYMLYQTTWLGSKEQIIYGKDIYGHDKTLLSLLEKLDGFKIISDSNTDMVQIVD